MMVAAVKSFFPTLDGVPFVATFAQFQIKQLDRGLSFGNGPRILITSRKVMFSDSTARRVNHLADLFWKRERSA